VIAGAGPAIAVGVESFAEVVARTVVAISPGSSDALVQQAVEGGEEASERAEIVVVLGLATAFAAATSAFARLERVPTASTARNGTVPRCGSTCVRRC
jgi:hypothetical protein